MRRLARLCIILLIGSATACAGSQTDADSPLKYSENAKKAYDEALKAFLDRDWQLTDQLMKDLKRKYGYSRYARLAELRLADAAYRQEKFAEAVGAYKAFAHDYPNDPEVPYARYRVTVAQFAQSSPSRMLPPLEERDLSSVYDAYSALRAFIADYPDYKRIREIVYMAEVVTGLLVRHELYVARYYLERGNFKPAISRAQYALRHFEDSGLEPEAIVLLGETYLKMKEHKKARAAFEHVLDAYPASAFTVTAQRFLAIMGKEPQAAATP